ncbi:hypothetical protein ACFX19_023621 [Malus domestica]
MRWSRQMNCRGPWFKPESEVLDGDALIVLCAASEDKGLQGAVGGEGNVDPLVGLGGEEVNVGVEEEGGEREVGPRPGEEEGLGFGQGEMEGLDLEV